MSLLNNISIRSKVIAAFGLLIVLFAAFGGYALSRMGALNDTIVELNDDMVPDLRESLTLKYQVARHRTLMARHQMANDEADIKKADSDNAEHRRAMLATQTNLEQRLTTADERAIFAKFKGEIEGYFAALDVVLEHSRRNDDATANQLFLATAAKYAVLLGYIEEIAQVNIKRSADEAEHAVALYNNAQFITWGLVAGALLLAIGSALLVIVSVSSPVAAMTRVMGVLAGGNLAAEIPSRDRGDEIGLMAQSVQVFKEGMQEAARLRVQQEETKRQAERERHIAMVALADRFEASVGEIVDGVASAAPELQSTAESMTATAEETSRQSNTVAAASEQTSQNVQVVAAAAEELSSSTREIGQRVAHVASLIDGAVQQSAHSTAQVQSLNDEAEKIGNVIKLITGIAAQTNLLALNAPIEAARAGEAGKGFAVVAAEVKALASQTARATDEIGTQIKAIQEATRSSAESIQGISTSIGRVNESATTIASAVEEQGAATQEISRNVAQASHGTQQVTMNMASVSEAANNTGAAAAQALSSAGELSRGGEKLRAQVRSFLSEVRAA